MAAQKPPMTSTDQVYEYFVSNVDAQAIDLGKVPIRWEEVCCFCCSFALCHAHSVALCLQVWKHFGTQLDPRTIIHAWLSTEAVINATSSGYRAIWSVVRERAAFACALTCHASC
jgi:hypothetical protein